MTYLIRVFTQRSDQTKHTRSHSRVSRVSRLSLERAWVASTISSIPGARVDRRAVSTVLTGKPLYGLTSTRALGQGQVPLCSCTAHSSCRTA